MCSRDELLQEVWRMPGGARAGSEGAGTNIVEVYINYLRKKLGGRLGRACGGREAIRTVRGEGYVLSGGREEVVGEAVGIVAERWVASA